MKSPCSAVATALLVLWTSFTRVAGRPPVSPLTAASGRKTENYYGKYNKCQYELWPWPKSVECTRQKEGGKTMVLDPLKFEITFTPDSKDTNSSILNDAIARYESLIFDQPTRISRGKLVEPQFLFEDDENFEERFNLKDSFESGGDKYLTVLRITILEHESVNGFNDIKPSDVDESYELNINNVATLTAPSIWGALYGLDTFSQLVQREVPNGGFILRGTPIMISDAPRYPWRGLLLDTSNHFLELSTIFRLIDGLSAAKLNVLHWHIMDSYSFPFASEKFPELHEDGRWTAEMSRNSVGYNSIYTPDAVRAVVKYATQRGVRVIPEIDMPGHGYSWGLSDTLRQITAACPLYVDELGHIDDVPLDPTNPLTYEVVTGVLQELAEIFPDQYFHLGGDEVKYGCWNESESITTWMKSHGMKDDFYALEQLFFERVGSFTTQHLQRKVVAWEEVFFDSAGGSNGDHGSWIGSDALPPSSTVVEVWTGPDYVKEATLHGYDALLAYGWYLDRQNPVDGEETWFFGDSWSQMYLVDPEPSDSENVNSADSRGKALGGEISMWSEQVDDLNIDSQIWPRAGAAAERLWSSQDITDLAAAAPRLSAFRCRLVSRFLIRAGPIWSDYCTATADYVKYTETTKK